MNYKFYKFHVHSVANQWAIPDLIGTNAEIKLTGGISTSEAQAHSVPN